MREDIAEKHPAIDDYMKCLADFVYVPYKRRYNLYTWEDGDAGSVWHRVGILYECLFLN